MMNETVATILGVAVVIGAVTAVIRGFDVRLVLLLAGLLLGCIAFDLKSVVQSLFKTLTDEKYLVPICSALGFAHVLRASKCDQNLVLLLVRPIQRVKPLLIPGSVFVGFVVNIAVISQTGTAIAVATVLIPLLRSVGLSPGVIGATLVLGASIGGELLNPGAPELQSVARHLTTAQRPVASSEMQPVLAPYLFAQLAVATLVFWLMTRREKLEAPSEESTNLKNVNYLKALVPILPLAFLLMAGPPFQLFEVPRSWLSPADRPETYASRLIGAAMVLGSIVAILSTPTIIWSGIRAFFQGVVFALINIITIIAAANCFGSGIKALNMAAWVGKVTHTRADAIWPIAGLLSFLFGMLSGSGMAATESLYRFFIQPGWPTEDNLVVGAVTAISAAAGRTTSPAAAVVLVCAPLVGVMPLQIVRRVFWPLALSTMCTVFLAAISR